TVFGSLLLVFSVVAKQAPAHPRRLIVKVLSKLTADSVVAGRRPFQNGSALFLVHHFGVDDRAFVLGGLGLGVVRGTGALVTRGSARCRTRLALGLGGFVKLGGRCLPGFVELLAGCLDGGGIGAVQRLFHRLDRSLDLFLVGGGQLVATFLQQFLGAVNGIVRLVPGLHFFAALLVLVGMRFCVFAHALDFVLGQTAAGRDRDLLFAAGAEILRAHMENTVRINVEGDLDLRHAARGRRNV